MHISPLSTPIKKREIRANVMLMLLIIGNHINLNIFLLCPIYGIKPIISTKLPKNLVTNLFVTLFTDQFVALI